MDNIIINFSSDPSGLQPGIDGLDKIQEADKAVADQAVKTMAAYEKRDKSIATGANDSKKSIDQLSSSVKNLDKSLVGGLGQKALDNLRNNIKLTDVQWKQFYQNIIKIAKTELVTASQKEDIEQLNQLINGAKTALDKMGDSEEKLTTKSRSMRAQLKDLKQELQQLEDTGQDNTVQFEQMAIKAGKLEDQIGDTNNRIRALGSDTFVFDALISGVTGLTGAFAAVQGAAALFGDENEDLQKALLKVNAAMSILQGLQAVQNVLQKQSAASIAVDLVLRRNQAAITTAQTVATEANAAATVEATVAQKGLNLAWLASPAGLLLVGITAVTAALFAFGGASKDGKEETDRLNESLQRQNELLTELSGDSFAAKIARLKLQLKGASDTQLFQFDVKEEERKLEEIKSIQARAFNERADFEQKNAEERRKALEAARKLGISEIRIDKDIAEQKEKQFKILTDKVRSANEAVDKQENKIKELQLNKDVKDYQDAQDKKKEADKKYLDWLKEQREKRYQDELDSAKSEVARTEAKLITAKKGSSEELNLRKKLLDQQYYAEILVRGKTIGELEKIDAQYYEDKLKLAKEFTQKEIEDAINIRISQANTQLSKESLNAAQENKTEVIRLKKEQIDAQADLDVQSLKKSIDNEELRRFKIREVYAKALADKQQLEKDKTKAEIDSLLASTLSAIDREISKKKRENVKNPDSDKAFTEELDLEEKKLDAKRIANFNLLQNKLIDTEEFKRRENDIDIAYDELQIQREQRKQDRISQIKQLAISAETQLLQVFQNISAAGYSREMEQVKQLFDAKKISQNEYDKRTRELRRKQAQDQKEQAIFETLLQQGPTILEGFKKGGFAGIAAGFALFFTMLNAVTSTKVPQFKTGKVRIDGPGSDTSDSILARISRNESVINASQTKKHESALRAINEDRYDQYLMNYELPRLYQNMAMPAVASSEMAGAPSGPTIDYERMAQATAQAIADNPQASLSIDEDGFRLSIRKGNEITEYKNKKLTT